MDDIPWEKRAPEERDAIHIEYFCPTCGCHLDAEADTDFNMTPCNCGSWIRDNTTNWRFKRKNTPEENLAAIERRIKWYRREADRMQERYDKMRAEL